MLLTTSFQRAMLSAMFSTVFEVTNGSPVKRQTFSQTISKDFPDPSVIQVANGNYYAYATAGNGVQIQVAICGDNAGCDLQDGHDALSPGSIAWAAENSAVWAPDVTVGTDGIYNMFFSTTEVTSGKHCLGFATSEDPLGPFVPVSDEPWVCDEAGDIDADQFLDEDGTRWVLWKVDGNSIGTDSTPIMIQQVEDDGYTKIGDAVEILNRDEVDGPLVEAPSLVKVDGTYYLTFSSNMYNTDLYDTSFATASSVTGPYTKAQAPDAPILTSDMMGLYGPGGADMLIGSDQKGIMLFHGWDSSDLNARCLYATRISFENGKISVDWFEA